MSIEQKKDNMSNRLTNEEMEELKTMFYTHFRIKLTSENYILRYIIYCANELIKRR